MLKKISRQLKFGIVFLEILLVFFVFILIYNFYLSLGKGRPLVYFDENNTSHVLDTLRESGYNITDWDHYLISKKALPQKGWYHICHTDEGRYHFFKQLNSHPAETMKIHVYSGETHKEMLHRLAKDMKLDEKKLNSYYDAHAHFKEGDIFSGTYTVARKADENTTLQHLFTRSKKRMAQFKKESFTHEMDDYTIKLLLTIASIIQKESNKPEEMPVIASVIYNRLEKGMKLQMDGTLNYGDYSHQVVTPERIKTDTSFYNTYKYKGLPPAPLATVSMQALKAAMFPAETDYLFFMLNKDGSHNFSKTYEEHLAHLRAFRAYQKERKKRLEKKVEKKKAEKKGDLKKSAKKS